MVKVQRILELNGKRFELKNKTLLGLLKNNIREAGQQEAIKYAYEVRDDIIDRLLAYKSPFGTNVIHRPLSGKMNEGELPPEPEEQKGSEPDRRLAIPVHSKDFLPKRYSSKPVSRIVPFKDHQPLNIAYLKQKIREGKDPRMLVSTGDYLRGIVVRRITKSVEEGVDSFRVTMANRKHKESGLWLKKLAQLHEFGTRSYTIYLFGNPKIKVQISVTRRPHWRPAMREAKEKRYDVIEKITDRTWELIEEELKSGR